MKPIQGYEDARDFSEIESLPVGPQACVITDVVDHPDKSYLEVKFDIVKGDYKGWFKSLEQNIKVWRGVLNRSYKESALGFFKAFITAVEKSNKGYDFVGSGWNEKSLIGKYVYVNFREEEYLKDGQVKVAVLPFEFRSIEAFNEGKIKNAPRKCLTEAELAASVPTTSQSVVEEDDDDLPF